MQELKRDVMTANTQEFRACTHLLGNKILVFGSYFKPVSTLMTEAYTQVIKAVKLFLTKQATWKR